MWNLISKILILSLTVAMSELIYGCTTWTFSKRLEKNLMWTTQRCCGLFWTSLVNDTPTKQLLVRLLTSYLANHSSKTTETYWTLLVKDELIIGVLFGISSHWCSNVSRPEKTCIHQLYANTGLTKSWERRMARKKVKGIRAITTSRWWWCINDIYDWQ